MATARTKREPHLRRDPETPPPVVRYFRVVASALGVDGAVAQDGMMSREHLVGAEDADEARDLVAYLERRNAEHFGGTDWALSEPEEVPAP